MKTKNIIEFVRKIISNRKKEIVYDTEKREWKELSFHA